MAFKIGVRSEKNDGLNAIVTDLITSAAFFQRKDIDIQQDENEFSFIFHGHCPNDYLFYLSEKYDLSLEYYI